jgi:hypothetical protein
MDRARPHANLDDDALFAEDLAIRYADSHRGHRSGHYKGVADMSRRESSAWRSSLK